LRRYLIGGEDIGKNPVSEMVREDVGKNPVSEIVKAASL